MTKSLRRHYKSYDECHGNERLNRIEEQQAPAVCVGYGGGGISAFL